MIRAKPPLDDVSEDAGLLLALDMEPLAMLLEEAKARAAICLNTARWVQEEVQSRYAEAIEKAFARHGAKTGLVRLPTACGRYELSVERFRRPDGQLAVNLKIARAEAA